MIRRDISIALLVALSFAGCTCTDIAGPDAQLREAAKGFEQLKAIPEVGLTISRLQVTRITSEPDLKPPRVVFSFDLDGHVGDVQVSAIGVERVPMEERGGRYVPATIPLPGLARVLAALRGAPASKRWVIRVDVGKTEVTEELADGTRKALTLADAPDGGFDIHE